MGDLMAFWRNFDADVAFSFTTPRQVRIKDRRLGIPYYTFLLLIVGYIVGYVIVYQKGYLMIANADGLARLQLKRPAVDFRQARVNLPFCDVSDPSEPYYTTDDMDGWYYFREPCYYQTEDTVVYPPDEVNAMFVTTRYTLNNITMKPDCVVPVDYRCDYDVGPDQTYYIPDIEYFTLRIDHSMDVPAFDVSESAVQMKADGFYGSDNKKVNPCDVYPKGECPSFIGSSKLGDIVAIKSLLQAAHIPGSSLDSILNPSTGNTTHNPPLAETRRSTGMVIMIDIEYSGVMSITDPTNPVSFSYQIRVRAVEDSEYKIVYDLTEVTDGSSSSNFLRVDRHGIRIVVRQSGQIGRFNVQSLLVALVSSVALLAVARTVVEFMAFKILPLKFIYKQYQTIETLDFSDELEDQDIAVFKKCDLINPPPRLPHLKKKAEAQVAAEVGNGTAAGTGAGAGRGSVAGSAANGAPVSVKTNTSVQERKHTNQDGFWGDLQVTYQGDWDGEQADGTRNWH